MQSWKIFPRAIFVLLLLRARLLTLYYYYYYYHELTGFLPISLASLAWLQVTDFHAAAVTEAASILAS